MEPPLALRRPVGAVDAAAELEELGFNAVWALTEDAGVRRRWSSAGGDPPDGRRDRRAEPVDAHTTAETAASYASLSPAHDDRFLLGI